ncbi:hypothetical protein FQZ97_930610 [compost metagenome]
MVTPCFSSREVFRILSTISERRFTSFWEISRYSRVVCGFVFPPNCCRASNATLRVASGVFSSCVTLLMRSFFRVFNRDCLRRFLNINPKVRQVTKRRNTEKRILFLSFPNR